MRSETTPSRAIGFSGSRQLLKTLSNPVLRRLKWLSGLFASPLSAIGTILVLIFVFLALQGENIAPYRYDDDAFDFTLDPPLEPNIAPNCDFPFNPFNPNCTHAFGTDASGRDVYSRVVLGTREMFRVAGLGTLIAVVIGSSIGLFIGYRGGVIDEVVGRVLDTLLSMPALLLALVLIGTLPAKTSYPSVSLSVSLSPLNLSLSMTRGEFDLFRNSVLIVIAIVYSPIVARVVRSTVLEIKTRGFVEAAQLRGENSFYILSREILPSVIPTLVVEASLRFSYAIFLVASLGFLGLGTDPTVPNWGTMVNEAYQNRDFECKLIRGEEICPNWTLQYPALAIVLLVVGVNLMSDGIKRLVQKYDE